MKRFIKQLLPDPLRLFLKRLRSLANLVIYKGKVVYCHVCDKQFSKFLKSGLHSRENAKCPYCGSLERHRLLWKYIQEQSLLNTDNKIKLLHMAPEPFFYSIFKGMDSIEYFPSDLQPKRYIGEVVQADITDLPFDENSFDAILCNHVLEHIPDDMKAIGELNRVMKGGGWSILQVPINSFTDKTYEDFSLNTPEERYKAFGQTDHVRRYGIDYRNRLEQGGFKVTEDEYIKKFSEEEIKRFGFDSSEIIYFCTK